MRLASKLMIPVAFVSLLLSACSSSGGASPLDGGNDGSTGGDDSSSGDTGVSGSTDADSTAGDTAGATSGSNTVGTTGGSTDIVGAAPIEDIQGEWSTACLEHTAGQFKRETISVIGARMLLNTAVFDDQECANPAMLNLSVSGTTIHQNATTVPTGAMRSTSLGPAAEVDFHFEDSTIDNKPLPEEDFIGKENYAAKIEYDIVRVEVNNLYRGDSSLVDYEGTTPETRPISLDLSNQFSRVP